MRTLKIAALVAVCLMLTTPAFAATRKYSGKLALSSFDCEKGPKSGSKYFTLESDSFLARFNLSPAQRGTVINFTADAREEEDRSNFENSIIGRLFLGKKGSGVGTLVFRSIRPVAIQQTFDSEDCKANISFRLGSESKAGRRPASMFVTYSCKNVIETTPKGEVIERVAIEDEKCVARYLGTVARSKK